MTELFDIDETTLEVANYRFTVRQTTAFDYLTARKILKEDRDDPVAIDLCLSALSIKSLEKKDSEGNFTPVEMPTMTSPIQLMERTKIPLHVWQEFSRLSADFNKLLTPDTLEK